MINLHGLWIRSGEINDIAGIRVVERAGDNFAVSGSWLELHIDELRTEDVVAGYL